MLPTMTYDQWPLEKKLLSVFREALFSERRNRRATTIIKLYPAPVGELHLEPGDTVVAELTNRSGQRFRFGTHAVRIESDRQWVRVPYESISAYCISKSIEECIAEKNEHSRKESLSALVNLKISAPKIVDSQRIILVNRQGTRYQLDGLGHAYYGLHGFFAEVVARNSKPV